MIAKENFFKKKCYWRCGGTASNLFVSFFYFVALQNALVLIQFRWICAARNHCGVFGINADVVVLVIQASVPGHLINYCTAVMKYCNAHTYDIRITESQFYCNRL